MPWIALASNMAVFGIDDLLPAIQSDVVDVVLLDPHWYGGLSRARFAGQLCELADVVICDYNYAFDPLIVLKRLFERGRGVTLLIDEAHNLPPRVRADIRQRVKAARA